MDPAPRPSAAGRTALPLLLGVLAAIAYGLMGVQQMRSLAARSWDLGIFSQLARTYAEMRAPIVPIKGDDFHLLGDHFHPLLVLLGPIWAVWPSPSALLWTQAILLGLSGIPLTRLAIDRLGLPLGTLAGLAYAFSFGLQAAVDVQFHEIAFAVPLLALSLTALLQERPLQAAVWGGLVVFVKEDLGLTVLMLGLVIALRAWSLARTGTGTGTGTDDRAPRRWAVIGMALAMWGILWFVLATYVILPAFNTAGQYDYTGNVGSLSGLLVPIEKWQTVGMLLLLAGIIGARSPIILLLLPTLAWRFVGTVPFYWDWTWHYGAVLMPIVIAALLDALGDRRTGRAAGLHRVDLPAPARPVRVIAVALSATATLMLGSALPITDLARSEAWEQSPRLAAAQQALLEVPDGAIVATDITLMAQLVPDHDVQWLHGPNRRVPDCVLVDDAAFSWDRQPPLDAAAWAEESYGAPFTERWAEDGFHVVCR